MKRNSEVLPGLVVATTFNNGRTPDMLNVWREEEPQNPIHGVINRAKRILGEEKMGDWTNTAVLMVAVAGIGAALAWKLRRDQIASDSLLTFEPEAVIGHSVGENAAMRERGMLGLDQLLRLIDERDKICRTTKTTEHQAQTGMAALSRVPSLLIQDLLRRARADGLRGVDLANVNTMSQVVLAGFKTQIDRFYRDYVLPAIDPNGKPPVKIDLEVRGAFHSSEMKPEQEKLIPTVNEVIGGQMPSPNGILVSPMFLQEGESGVIETGDQGLLIAREQLTRTVDYPRAWSVLLELLTRVHDEGIRAVIGYDPSGRLESIIRPNLPKGTPVVTISGPESLRRAWRTLADVYPEQLGHLRTV